MKTLNPTIIATIIIVVMVAGVELFVKPGFVAALINLVS